ATQRKGSIMTGAHRDGVSRTAWTRCFCAVLLVLVGSGAPHRTWATTISNVSVSGSGGTGSAFIDSSPNFASISLIFTATTELSVFLTFTDSVGGDRFGLNVLCVSDPASIASCPAGFLGGAHNDTGVDWTGLTVSGQPGATVVFASGFGPVPDPFTSGS